MNEDKNAEDLEKLAKLPLTDHQKYEELRKRYSQCKLIFDEIEQIFEINRKNGYSSNINILAITTTVPKKITALKDKKPGDSLIATSEGQIDIKKGDTRCVNDGRQTNIHKVPTTKEREDANKKAGEKEGQEK